MYFSSGHSSVALCDANVIEQAYYILSCNDGNFDHLYVCTKGLFAKHLTYYAYQSGMGSTGKGVEASIIEGIWFLGRSYRCTHTFPTPYLGSRTEWSIAMI